MEINKKDKKLKKIITLSSLLFLLLLGCESEKSPEEQLKDLRKQKTEIEAKISELMENIEQEEKLTVVEVEEIGTAPFEYYMSLFGTVESDKNIQLSPKAMGLVLDVKVEEGQMVRKGQILAQLDDQIVNKRLKEAKDSYEFIKTVYEKQKRVWDKKVGSEIEYLQAKNNKENMENKISLLEEELENMKIKAPFSGYVNDVMIKEGEMASPNFPAFNIVSNTDLKIKTDISESMITKLNEGDEVKTFFPDIESDTLNLKINTITESINPNNRTVSVFIDLPSSAYKKVKPEMLAKTIFRTAKLDSAKVIPMNLVKKEGTTEYVYVAQKDENSEYYKAEKKIIKTSNPYNGMTEVKEGLEDKDLVITVGHESLNEGKPIEIKQ